MFKGRANPEAAKAFLERHGVNLGQVREFCGVPVSALALGTYLGEMNEVIDMKVALAAVAAVEHGCNFFDTAINYRGQRAERSLGEAIKRLVLAGKARREELFVSTKGGFVPYEKEPTSDLTKLFEAEYVSRGIVKSADLVGGCHCMEPAYLDDQIERSRKNLGIETIDLYYIHNPETQLEELPERIFYEKLERAFVKLEEAVKEGRIAAYGLATWNGFREEPGSQTALQLEKCVLAAEKASDAVGAACHHLRAIQLPLNLAMPEAALMKTQRFGQNLYSAVDAASVLDVSVAVSVPLFQARLCHNLPDFILEKFPKDLSQAHCALAFATGFNGVDAAMVGMKQPDHVNHDLEFLKRKPLSETELREVVSSMLA
ncbi:MAG: aldo/keto reductase [Deltaproteobacteria bacterium]|nr:aldo/keto reductase [Deltaproteobacteria bacterium]